jgi:hypothetical protein
MDQGVRVRVAGQAARMRNLDTTQHTFAPGRKRVHINAMAYAQGLFHHVLRE